MFCESWLSTPTEVPVTGLLNLGACIRPSDDEMQSHSRICRPGLKIDPINTILGNIVGVGKVNFPIRSKGVLIGEVLERGEINAGCIGQVLTVDAKRPIEIRAKGVGLAFTNWVEAISIEMRVNYVLMITDRPPLEHTSYLGLGGVATYPEFLVHQGAVSLS